MSLPLDVATEIQKLAPSSIIELFELDGTVYGGDVLRFHSGTNELRQNIVWQGNIYTRFPISITGFEYNGQGQIPRPKMKVSNFLSAITTIVQAHNDLLGAKLTRKRTMVKFLDAVNFSGGNADEDPDSHFDDDVYFIDRKSNEDRDIVEFELASAFDLVNVGVPNRQVVQNVCVWKYRGAECGFTGGPLFDINDQQITLATSPEGISFIAAYNGYVLAQADLDSKESILRMTSINKDKANNYIRTQRLYSKVSPAYYVTATATSVVSVIYNDLTVSIGDTYRRGSFVETDALLGDLYYIEKWEVDTSDLSNATTEYLAALFAYEAAFTVNEAAIVTYNDALEALPGNDPLYRQERCGKRLSSCKKRFGTNNEIPFGAFPSVGLIK